MTGIDGISLRQKKKKFYSKSLASLIPILSLIGEGLYQEQIALKLGLPAQRVHYHVKRAKELGWVKESVRSSIKTLELTQEGKKVLDRCEKGLDAAPTSPFLLENLQLAAEVIEGPTKPIDWKRVQKKNWAQHQGKVDGIFVTLNEGKTKKVVFNLTKIPGDSLSGLMLAALHEYQRVAVRMFELFGIRLGQPEQVSRPEFVVYDPFARQVCKDIGQVTIPGIGKINASRPLSRGEVEYFNLEDLAAYVVMPRKIQQMKYQMNELSARITNGYLRDWHPFLTHNN